MAKRVTFHHGNLRAVLIEAAAEALEQRGIGNLSLKQLAVDARVAPSAPYRHFENKLALLAELIDRAHDQMVQAFARIPVHLAPDVRLTMGCRVYLQFAASRPQMFQLLFADDLFWQREFGSRPAAHSGAFERFAELVGAVIPDIETEVRLRVTFVCWTLLHGLAALNVAGALHQAGQSAMEETIISTIERLPRWIADVVDPDAV